MRNRGTTHLIAMVAFAAVLAAGCGDDGDTSGAPVSVAGSAGDPPVSLPGTVDDHGTEELGVSTEVALELGDQYFAPTFVDGPAGATVELTLVNSGDLPHTFTIDDVDVDEELAAGATATVTVTLPDDGSLRFYCRFHVSAGMQGAFVVPGAANPPVTTVVSGGAPGY